MTYPEWKSDQRARAVVGILALVALGVAAGPLVIVGVQRLREWLGRRDADGQRVEEANAGNAR